VDLEFVSRIDKTEVIEIPEQVLPAPAAEVTYKREDISQEPAWIRRALRNSVEHKRTVDTYRYQEKTQTETKTRNYLNRAPQAASDSASTQQNQSVVIDVLSNDADPDSDAITISTVGNAAHGTATIQSQKFSMFRIPITAVMTASLTPSTMVVADNPPRKSMSALPLRIRHQSRMTIHSPSRVVRTSFLICSRTTVTLMAIH
jgi:hypothetical protein